MYTVLILLNLRGRVCIHRWLSHCPHDWSIIARPARLHLLKKNHSVLVHVSFSMILKGEWKDIRRTINEHRCVIPNWLESFPKPRKDGAPKYGHVVTIFSYRFKLEVLRSLSFSITHFSTVFFWTEHFLAGGSLEGASRLITELDGKLRFFRVDILPVQKKYVQLFLENDWEISSVWTAFWALRVAVVWSIALDMVWSISQKMSELLGILCFAVHANSHTCSYSEMLDYALGEATLSMELRVVLC